jgi:hypothetical protein
VGVNGPNEVGDAQRLITWLAGRSEVETDGLYFDPPTDPETTLTVHHTGVGESQLSLSVGDDGSPGRGQGNGRGRGRGRGRGD